MSTLFLFHKDNRLWLKKTKYQVIYINLMNGEDKVHQPIYTKMNVDTICEIIASLKLPNMPNAASCKGGNFKILYEREY